MEQLSELTTWESQLEAALKHVRIENSQEDPDTLRESLFKSLTALRNNLTAALHYEPQKQTFKGNVHLLRPRGASDVEFCELQKVRWIQAPIFFQHEMFYIQVLLYSFYI